MSCSTFGGVAGVSVEIYTDGIHLACSDLQALHEFARLMDLKKCWFHRHKKHPHYDLTTAAKVAKAIEQGAILVSSKELVKNCFC